jgi:hypothetical protein
LPDKGARFGFNLFILSSALIADSINRRKSRQAEVKGALNKIFHAACLEDAMACASEFPPTIRERVSDSN